MLLSKQQMEKSIHVKSKIKATLRIVQTLFIAQPSILGMTELVELHWHTTYC